MKELSKILVFVLVILFVLLKSMIGLAQTPIVIKNANVITMALPESVIKNATVVISGNTIQSINGLIPPNATVVDAKGKWLIPGLIDAHVHLPIDGYFGPKDPLQVADFEVNTQDVMIPMLANGVTTVVDMDATSETFSQKKAIEKGYVIGPRIALAALIDGSNGKGRIANTAEEGRMIVRTAKADGYDFIKVYSKLNIETFTAIVDEASKLGLKAVGHIPDAFQGKLEQAFIPNFTLVAHAEEFSKHSESFTLRDVEKFAKLAKANGTSLSPTLITMVWIAKQTHSIDSIKNLHTLKYVHPLIQSKWLTANKYVRNASPENEIYFDNMVKFHFEMVKAFKTAGVPIIAGTDVGVPGIVAGFSLHDELQLLVQAGLTPQEALDAATIVSAKTLGIDKYVGSVEVGKFADLVLLDENPLVDIRNTRKIASVFVNGRWIDQTKLTEMLANLAAANTANKEKFDWKTFTNKKK